MREIRCEFSTVRLVHSVFVRTETVRFYRDEGSPTVNFDIIQDYLKLLWGTRLDIACIDIKVFVNGNRVGKPSEIRLKAMIDSTLLQCDGSIPMTQLQMSLLIDKVKAIKNSVRGMNPGNESDTKE